MTEFFSEASQRPDIIKNKRSAGIRYRIGKISIPAGLCFAAVIYEMTY